MYALSAIPSLYARGIQSITYVFPTLTFSRENIGTMEEKTNVSDVVKSTFSPPTFYTPARSLLLPVGKETNERQTSVSRRRPSLRASGPSTRLWSLYPRARSSRAAPTRHCPSSTSWRG